MKIKSYKDSCYRSVSEFKGFLLELGIESDTEYILSDIINNHFTNKMIIREIRKRKKLLVDIMLKIEDLIEGATTLNEIEDLIVSYNMIMPSKNSSVTNYKKRLFKSLLKKRRMDDELYCVIRHLIGHNKKITDYLLRELCNDDSHYYNTMMVITSCIEKRYNDAFNYLDDVINSVPIRYQKELYMYKPTKFSRTMSQNVCTTLNTVYIA